MTRPLGPLSAEETALWDRITADVCAGGGAAGPQAMACIAAAVADAAVFERRQRVARLGVLAVPPIVRCGAEHCDMDRPDALPDSDPCIDAPGHPGMHRSIAGAWSPDSRASATREQAEQRRQRARARAS